jgi:hypothetical protein
LAVPIEVPVDPGDLGCVVELARQRGYPEVDAPARAGIGREESPSDWSRQQLGLEIGVGLVQQFDCLIDERTIHSSDCDEYV